MDYAKIDDMQELESALSSAYTLVGGYPKYYITTDNAVLSHASAIEELEQVRAETTQYLSGDTSYSLQWAIAYVAVNYESELYCDHSGDAIETAYGVAA